MYKYGITPKELSKARKLIIADIRSNNKVEHPIMDMTLQDYFNVIKEIMLGATNSDGVVVDPWGDTWYTEFKKKDIRIERPIDVAKAWMDGRGLFTEHFNGGTYGDKKTVYGNWEHLGQHDQNQWYHEERLTDINWFKQCIHGSIGAAGHPTENLGAGNIVPVEFAPDKWYILFDTFHRGHYYTLKGYLRLKDRGIPAFIYAAHTYLTPSQQTMLQLDGFLANKDYNTGYYVCPTSNAVDIALAKSKEKVK